MQSTLTACFSPVQMSQAAPRGGQRRNATRVVTSAGLFWQGKRRLLPRSPPALPQPAPGLGSLDPNLNETGGLVLGTEAPKICTFWVSGTPISRGRRIRLPPAELKLPGGVWGLGPMCSNSSAAPCSCLAVNTSPVIQS